jgi:hypothetical protein
MDTEYWMDLHLVVEYTEPWLVETGLRGCAYFRN